MPSRMMDGCRELHSSASRVTQEYAWFCLACTYIKLVSIAHQGIVQKMSIDLANTTS